MHLTDHITDVQLNEYLDHETNDRAQIELHLSSCSDCAARLSILQALFDEIESLPELSVAPEFAARFMPIRSEPVQLPRSLTLTVILQAALAVVAIMVAAPLVMQFVSSYTPSLSVPSLADVFIQLQSQWRTWLDMLSQFQLSIPQLPSLEIPGLMLTLTLLGASFLWLVGNGLLLRNQMK
jgi:hypothetical protein